MKVCIPRSVVFPPIRQQQVEATWLTKAGSITSHCHNTKYHSLKEIYLKGPTIFAVVFIGCPHSQRPQSLSSLCEAGIYGLAIPAIQEGGGGGAIQTKSKRLRLLQYKLQQVL